MWQSKAQKKAEQEQKMAAASARNQRLKTMSKDLSMETMDLYRRYGAMGGSGGSQGKAPMSM